MAVATKVAGQQSWDSDAEFRADTLAIHNALIATGGLVQTADTGQTDHTANTRAAGGYNIYRFDDPDQATHPIFIKVEWFPTATTRPGAQFTVGTSSNGSGTIGGVIRSATQISGGSAGSTGAAAADHYVSVGDGYLYIVFAVVAGASPSSVSCIFFFERSTDEEGVTHPTEGYMSFSTPANSKSYAAHPIGLGILGPSSGSPFDGGASSGFWDDVAGADVGIMPIPYLLRSNLRFHRACFARLGRFSPGVAFDAVHLGATRKLISIEGAWYHSSTSNGWSNYSTSWPTAILLPWT